MDTAGPGLLAGRTVLLARSRHVGWMGLRSMMEEDWGMHAVSPASKIVAIAEQASSETIHALREVGVDGYLLWQRLSPPALYHCLMAVVEAGLRVSSPVTAEDLAGERARQAGGRPVRCTEQQKAVLQGLAAGLTLPEIAERQSLSLRTVERTIAALEDKLEAPTRMLLGMRAVELGLS